MAEGIVIHEKPIADPGPLGLAAFALTTFILSMSSAQLVPAEARCAVRAFGHVLWWISPSPGRYVGI